ncbi:MAG: phosphotransferase enzyme family protein, partial [Paracoccaceae bacterium]
MFDALLPRFGLPPETPVRLLNRSENETYLAGDALILRVHRPGYHTAAEIESELLWLQALQSTGLRCVVPVAAKDGNLLQIHKGRHAAAFVPIAAREVTEGDDLVHWFGELGRISAALHAHARVWPRPTGFVRKRWDAETILGAAPHWGDWRAAVGLDAGGHAVLQRLSDDLVTRLPQYGTGADRFGLIHADLRLTNLMLD